MEQWLALLLHSKKVLGLNHLDGGLSACSPHAVSEVRLTGDSKLSIAVNGFLSVCVSAVTDWRLVLDVAHLSPCGSWDRLQGLYDPELEKRIDDCLVVVIF